jgi:hypothetical protein
MARDHVSGDHAKLGRERLVVGNRVDEAREHLVVFIAVEQCDVPERHGERERVLHAVVVVARRREQRLGEPHDLRGRTLAPLSAREVRGGGIEVPR